MSKAVTLLKYTGAMIVFVISYVICSVIAHIGVRLVNFDARGFWIDFLPYFAAFMAGILSVLGGLSVVERVFPTVRPRTVAWVFIGLMSFFWGLPLLGLLMGLVGLIDAPLQSHVLWSADTPPQAVQALAAVIAAWKMTAAEGDFGPR
ncbi:MAG: hypothetical protein IIA63_08310 [Nitrospinae bacterium]|nr:hypothetical protein [Nitrospinota bacterium]